MSHRITIGIDPGQSGAIAVLADGWPIAVHDMPTVARRTKGYEVSASGLLNILHRVKAEYPDAHIFGAVEMVGGMPGQGVVSSFHFGQSYGTARCSLTALHIGYKLVAPTVWKRYHGLIGAAKDSSRTVAIQKYPAIAHFLERKKDDGRAEAILIAAWCYTTEQHAQVAGVGAPHLIGARVA